MILTTHVDENRTEPLNMFIPPKFALRFPIDELDKWASKYDVQKQKDHDAQTAADTAKERGFMKKEEFLAVVQWKSPRPRRWAEDNTDDDIEDASKSAFSTTNGRVRIGVLMTLRGVSYPMASAILHLVWKDVPLLDVNALAALSVKKPSSYSFQFWNAYCAAALAIVEKKTTTASHDRPGALDLWERAPDTVITSRFVA
jgi:hypothetical protein